MGLVAWLGIAVAVGALVGAEGWAWMRHGRSAIAVVAAGAGTLVAAVTVAGVVGLIALGMLAGLTGIDPLGVNNSQADTASGECDPNYSGACLDPAAEDYDCEGNGGNGPEYSGTVEVVGDDVYDLDRDGDGTGCD